MNYNGVLQTLFLQRLICLQNRNPSSIFRPITMVAHFAAGLFVGYVIYVAVPGSSLFSWHPTLMVIAMTLLMFEAIMVFSPQSSLISSYSRATKGNVHGYMMAGALFCALAGFSIIYYNKNINNKDHFTTWHGLLGLLTILYLCAQTTGGLCLKYYNLIKGLQIRLADLKLYHATSGLCAFTFVICTILLGMYSTWFTDVTSGTTWYACMACLSCMSMMVMQQITTAYLPQARVQRNVPQSQKKKKNK